MSEAYVECLIKAKQSSLAKAGRVILIVLTVLFGLGALFVIWLAVPAVLTGFGAYFLNMMTDLEFEYLYLDKELVIDKVMAKTRRKRVATYSLESMEIVAPIKSYHLDGYKNREVKTLDYSIREVQQPDQRYVFYCEGNQKVIFSPSETLIKAMRNVAPRKVFME